MQISNLISEIQTSKTIQVKEKALKLKSSGIDVVDLTAGEPDFQTPDFIREAGIKAIRDGFTKYTENAGIPGLRQKIARKLKEDNQLEYAPEQIIVSNGAKQCILNALMAILNKGDEVIFQSPYWVSYPEQTIIAGGKPVTINTLKTRYKIDPDELRKNITPKTRILIFNSPSNPTGIVYSREELNMLAEILIKENIWIISDEIYEKIIYDGLKHYSIAAQDKLIEKCIVINGFSKSYSMTGWRLGYAAGPLPIIKAMSKIQSHYTSNASSISQKAAEAALSGAMEEITEMAATFEQRRNYIKSQLDGSPYFDYVFPQGAFYFFINISKAFGKTTGTHTINNSVDFSNYATENYHVVTVPGVAFGADDFIRLSFAASQDDLKKGMQRLIKAMDQLIQGSK
jgi:aspartate aminotransferase